MKGLWQLLSQAKTIQEKMAKVQQELREKTVEASAGGGMVTVKVNGEGQILSIKIEPEVVDSKDMEMLEDLVLAAVNEGLRKAHQLMTEEMGRIAGGLDMPGLSQMLGSGT
ncbi:YbaB/EbfC family nucleoid-associated protein [candidate division NPL-UPA2 bacterium]|nr:YbaB/EbfC family nucleoid-associated protein [candidate division NPL-UPA2 bacterium]